MRFFDLFKRKKKPTELTDKQLLDKLWKDWTKAEFNLSPINELLTITCNLGAGGHCGFFELCEEDEHFMDALNVALPYLPRVIKDNLLEAKAIYDRTKKDAMDDDFLNEFDDVLYDNMDFLEQHILSLYKEMI